MKDFINNENEEFCRICQGECCKNSGCAFSPRDFRGEITKERLVKLLNTGIVSLDWWEGDPNNTSDSSLNDTVEKAFFIRIRNFVLDDEDKLAPIIDPSFGGRCILLTKKGCKLSFENRPLQGQALVPMPRYNKCEIGYSKRDCCIEWLRYDTLLNEVYLEYCNYDFLGQCLHNRDIEPQENGIDNLISILEG